MPYMVSIKQLLEKGAIGKILSVNLEYLLDTVHGADYFRRWHRKKENSGGLLVHKSTHHFDLVNWWIGDEPELVYANGATGFFGSTREERGERCITCRHASSCEFGVKYHEDPFMQGMYYKAEKEDGYFRDRCVFSDEIDIEDSMSVSVKYLGGALLTYSLIAHSPYEGWKLSISGTEGRLEATQYYSGQMADDPFNHISVFDRKGGVTTYQTKKAEGNHDGGDERLQEMLFRGVVSDPLGQYADSRDGVISAMIGISANKSIREKRAILIKELL